jgi:hypothetical protein
MVATAEQQHWANSTGFSSNGRKNRIKPEIQHMIVRNFALIHYRDKEISFRFAAASYHTR